MIPVNINVDVFKAPSFGHLELGDELCEDAEEGFCPGGLAVLAEVGGHLGELLHGPGLQGLQRLDRRVAVLQEALRGYSHVTNPILPLMRCMLGNSV